ncbi:sulfite exporter TauE/SafE family protein [Desulfovibrio inopinatus]|uniref:urease accessory protein UreH domain-containing protein n=1 Tax=Desulfovibrio inopinatus TaxID=102109 RepID=UPI0003FFF9C2|nr:sulfite exporter TauE/SafE family protein [Desulfovibrio inopinatus]
MVTHNVFWVALQSSLVLGLVHGVNPCGHSWLVLAPFVAGDKQGKRVFALTTAFISGTTLGCLAIGAILGALSTGLPDSMRFVADIATAGIVIGLGVILLVKPHLLHSHDHEGCGCHAHDDHHHDHDHHHDEYDHHCCHHDDHDHDHAHGVRIPGLSSRVSTVWGLALVGFVNMIVPCPTVALMYSYAIDSQSVPMSLAVFSAYAVGTAISLAAVIYGIYRVTGLMRRLQSPWVEPLIMRTVGVLTIFFGVYSLYADFFTAATA